MSKEQVTWKMVCCNTIDAVINNNLEAENLRDLGYQSAYELLEGIRNGKIFRFKLYSDVAKELGWCKWFNEVVSEYTGYKINENSWRSNIPYFMYTDHLSYSRYYEFDSFKSFVHEIDVTVVDEVKFSLSLLSQDLRFKELKNCGYPRSNVGFETLTPKLARFVMEWMYE